MSHSPMLKQTIKKGNASFKNFNRIGWNNSKATYLSFEVLGSGTLIAVSISGEWSFSVTIDGVTVGYFAAETYNSNEFTSYPFHLRFESSLRIDTNNSNTGASVYTPVAHYVLD